MSSYLGHLEYINNRRLIFKGLISGSDVLFKSSSELYIDSGIIDINSELYNIEDQITKSLESLSTSTIYHVYIKPPTSGTRISSSQVEYSTTAPTRDSSKAAGYHPSNTTWRWIGWFETDGSGDVDSVESVHTFNALPIGNLEHNFRSTASFGRLELNGSAISRSTYSELYTGSP